MTAALSIPVHLVVRYACECAALGAWRVGLDLPELVVAAEAADRRDFGNAAFAAANAAQAAKGAGARGSYAYDAALSASTAALHASRVELDGQGRAVANRLPKVLMVTPWAHAASFAAIYATGLEVGFRREYPSSLVDNGDATREQCAQRAMELFGLRGGRELRYRVAAHIEAHPELHDQGHWGDGSPNPVCNTPCCVAGWACHLGGGSRGLPVWLAAAALLYMDDAPLPRFDGVASRRDVLATLRGS